MDNLTAHESRALMMGLEAEYNLPTGSLQAINEQMTGYRQTNPLLPGHVEPSGDRMEQHVQAAKRFAQKMREFDGIMPLAIDAYYRGDKSTQASLEAGAFDQDAINSIYSTMARVPKYGGEDFTPTDYENMYGIIGQPTQDFTNIRNTPIPRPAKPGNVREYTPGRFYTGDIGMDTKIYIESKGDPKAVSPTGPVGILQYTKATARRFGLIGNGFDHRTDPVKSVEAQAQADAVYAATLKRNGIEPTPLNVYLAHQQGEGGIVEIIRAAKSGRNVSPKVRTGMNHNGGKGKTPAQFLAFWQDRWNRAENEVRKLYRQSGPAGRQSLLPDGSPTPADSNMENMQSVMESIPSMGVLSAVSNHGGNLYVDPTQPKTEPDPFSSGVNWMATLDSVFSLARPKVVPPEVHNAIKGVFESV